MSIVSSRTFYIGALPTHDTCNGGLALICSKRVPGARRAGHGRSGIGREAEKASAWGARIGAPRMTRMLNGGGGVAVGIAR